MNELVDDCQNNLEILITELQKSEEGTKAGRTIEFEDFKQKLRTKYNI